jgi:ketosteroid isomerase-like protein
MPEINVVDAIREANENFAFCMLHADARALAQLYADDAMLLPPGSDFVDGKEEVRSFWKNEMDNGISNAEFATMELHDFGSMAIEIGTYKLHAGSAVVDTGKYVIIWRQENLGWKLYRETWNSSAVAAKATAA